MSKTKTMRERLEALYSARDGVATRVSYRRRSGAWDGPGWYVQPFGGQECRVPGTIKEILAAEQMWERERTLLEEDDGPGEWTDGRLRRRRR